MDSAVPLSVAEQQPLTTGAARSSNSGRLGGSPFRLGALANRLEGAVILPLSELNRLRRNCRSLAELETLRATPKRWQLDGGVEGPSNRRWSIQVGRSFDSVALRSG